MSFGKTLSVSIVYNVQTSLQGSSGGSCDQDPGSQSHAMLQENTKTM